MLLCRYDRTRQHSHLRVRSRSLSTATRPPAQVSRLSEETEQEIGRPQRSPQSARITGSANGQRNLELILHNTAASKPASGTQSVSGDPPPHCVISIDGFIKPQETQSKPRPSEQSSEDEPSMSWDDILQTLEERTPDHPTQLHYLNLHGSEEHIREIHCRLVHNPTFSVSLEPPTVHFGRARLFMKGDVRNLRYVKRYIQDRRLSNKIRGDIEEETADSYWVRRRRASHEVRPGNPARHPNDIPRPSSWTARSLAEYIQTLTSIKPPDVLRTGTNFKDQVEEIIFDLMRENGARRYLTFGVFYRFLTYLLDQRKMPTAWALMSLMEDMDFLPTTLHYNVMLSTSARDAAPQVFSEVLETMKKRGFAPDTGTWVALLMAPTTTEFKQNIMRRMFDKGLAAHSAFEKESAALIIPYSLRPFLETGGSVTDYLDSLDDIWGPTWVTDNTVCQIVDVLAARGSVVEAVHLVDHLSDTRGYNHNRMSKAPLHILLKHCLRSHSADLAVWLIVYSADKWKSHSVDRITLRLMFAIAWKARLYNLLRVVFVYASADGQLDHRIRGQITQSLENRRKPPETSVRADWMASAGCVVCNADPLLDSGSPQKILERQSARFERVKPSRPFAQVLVQALFQDKEWAEKGVRKTTGTTWKRVNAIKISVRPYFGIRDVSSKLSRRDKKKDVYRPRRRAGTPATTRL